MAYGPAPPDVLAVDVSRSMHRVQVTVRGELDLAGAPELETVLESVAEAGDLVVLDLRGVTFIDAIGIALLVRFAREARSRGARAALVPNQSVRRLLEVCSLLDGLTCLDAPPAVAAARAPLAQEAGESLR